MGESNSPILAVLRAATLLALTFPLSPLTFNLLAIPFLRQSLFVGNQQRAIVALSQLSN